MQHTIRGTIHGKTIELAVDPGLLEGQWVEVILKTDLNASSTKVTEPRPRAYLDDWTEEDDRILEMLHRERKADAGREISE